jgi:hypothetical protein
MANALTRAFELEPGDRAELGEAYSKLKEVHEFLSDALDAMGGDKSVSASRAV